MIGIQFPAKCKRYMFVAATQILIILEKFAAEIIIFEG